MTTHVSRAPLDPQLFEANLLILRRRFPEVAEAVNFVAETWTAAVLPQPSRSGMPTMSARVNGASVYVHSTFQPAVEAARWAREPLERAWDFAVVYGMGLGYHLDVLLEQRPQCRLVVVEPRADVLFAAMALKDQRRLLSHPYLELYSGGDPAVVASKLFSAHLKGLLDEAPFFVWPAATRYAPEYWRAFQSRLTDLFRATRSDMATRRTFQLQWVNNFLKNLHHAVNDPGISSLRDRLAGRPAIVVAAGPSLEQNIHLLREAKDRAVVIAAGSAINPLLKNRIEPDLLVSFDPSEANYQHFENLRTSWLPLVYVPTIFPRIIEEYPGPRFTAAMDTFPFITWFFNELGEEKGLLASGPSVANVSWYLANELGLNPIILVGQDLAFTRGKTHAAGAAHARTVDVESEEARGRLLLTEGVDGTPVPTTTPMYAMKVWFEQRLMKAPKDRMTIDATEGGAKIEGTAIMTLEEALAKYCQDEFTPYETIMSVHRAEAERLAGQSAQERVRHVLGELREDLFLVVRVATDALQSARQLLRESQTKRLNEQRLKEAATRLGRHAKGLTTIAAYKVFIEPVNLHILRAIGLLLRRRLEKETDLYGKGTEVARLYSTLFSSSRDMARHIVRLLKEQGIDSSGVSGQSSDRG